MGFMCLWEAWLAGRCTPHLTNVCFSNKNVNSLQQQTVLLSWNLNKKTHFSSCLRCGAFWVMTSNNQSWQCLTLQSPFVQPFKSEQDCKDRAKHHKEMQTKCRRGGGKSETHSSVCAAAARQRQPPTASCLQLFTIITLIKHTEFNSLYSNVI